MTKNSSQAQVQSEPGQSVGFAAALEQLDPLTAIALATKAEANGFKGVLASERSQPWVPAQGQASFSWSVLGALGMNTTGNLMSGTTIPGYRWHPSLVAQASATIAAMFPGRHLLAIGSGEAIDEHVVGGYWPETAERIDRMFESIEIIQKLFNASIADRDAKHSGKYFKLESTRLWTMPLAAPQILVATSGPVTAKRAGRNVDGLLIDGAPIERIPQLFQKFQDGAHEVGKKPGNMAVRLHLSWASTTEEAMRNAREQWPIGGLRFPRSDIRSPFEFEQLAKMVRDEDFEGKMTISSDPDEHRAEIQKYLDLGFDQVYLHNVGRNQEEWIEVFGRDVLPKLGLRR